jgi:hypothetical protein
VWTFSFLGEDSEGPAIRNIPGSEGEITGLMGVSNWGMPVG